jgi:hypothetical protein
MDGCVYVLTVGSFTSLTTDPDPFQLKVYCTPVRARRVALLSCGMVLLPNSDTVALYLSVSTVFIYLSIDSYMVVVSYALDIDTLTLMLPCCCGLGGERWKFSTATSNQ